MTLKFDHLVYFTDQNLESLIEQLKENGLYAVKGGSHEKWGTHNALCHFGLSYVEFLAIENETVAKQSDLPLIRQLVKELPKGSGPGQFAIRTNNIERLNDELQEKGLSTQLFPGSRKREDGTQLTWKLLFIEWNSDGLLPPFFIDWGQDDEKRLFDLKKRSIIKPHPAGDLQMDHLKIIVQNAKEQVLKWRNWFGLTLKNSYQDENLQAECYILQLDGCPIHFCSPAGEGKAMNFLKEKGERPYALVLSDQSWIQ